MERASLTASISAVLSLLILLFGIGAAAQPASAPPVGDCQASPECAKELATGVNDYQQRNYELALTIFQKAFDRSNDPRILVLMGRAHFKRGDSRRALEFYERALPQITNPADRTKLEQYLAEARAKSSAPDLTPHPESAVTQRPSEPLGNPPPPATEKKMKPWMWVLVGVAAAAVVGTAVGVGVTYGKPSPTPDKTITFP